MNIDWNSHQFQFTPIPLSFEEGQFKDVWAEKNNKTLRQTLRQKRYGTLAEEACRRYPERLDSPLGHFLMILKQNGDDFYLRFLNKYCDLSYVKFRIDNERIMAAKGLYLYQLRNAVQYIGRCKDSCKKRINQGYGTIHPKNCLIDGQATNCHINALIARFRDDIRLFVCPLDDPQLIEAAEAGLVQRHRPPWNIQGV